MYTYSFKILQKYTNTPESYYLFGDSKPGVEVSYKHLFHARGWKVYPPASGMVSPDSPELQMLGEGLKYQKSLRARLINDKAATEADFETYAINVTFYVTGNPYCAVLKVPSGTVLKKDIFQDRFVIRDMRFYGCQWGSLYASVHLWRGIRNPKNGQFTHLYVSNHRDLYMGRLGCPTGCLRCNSTNYCLLCDNSTSKFLSNGKCLDKCPL